MKKMELAEPKSVLSELSRLERENRRLRKERTL